MRPRVLLAQDDRWLREAFIGRLRRDGVVALGVGDAVGLLALAEAAALDPLAMPDLIVADLDAPDDDLLRLLEAIPRPVLWKVPIVVVARDAGSSFADRARRIGCAVVVSPLDLDELRELALALLPGTC